MDDPAALSSEAAALARIEGLEAHARAAELRSATPRLKKHRGKRMIAAGGSSMAEERHSISSCIPITPSSASQLDAERFIKHYVREFRSLFRG